MMVMRSKSFLFALPIAVAVFAPAVSAQDVDDVVFVSGVGASAVDEPSAPPPLADSDSDAEIRNLGDKMSDPSIQAGVAAMVEQMASTMMQLPVGNFAAAIENARPGTVRKRIRRNATIADLAGRDAEDLPEELGYRSREMMGMMGGLANAFAVMLPEFKKMSREMEEGFRAAKERTKRN
jgi:hypothetical protein